MNISFNGIYNVNVIQDFTPQEVSYSIGGKRKVADASYRGLEMQCVLTDDTNGNHLSAYKDLLKKYNINADSMRDVFVSIKQGAYKFKDKDENVTVLFNKLEFNGDNVNLEDKGSRPLLPIYSYMAKLTSEIFSEADSTNVEARSLLKELHNTVTTNAVNFIENIM